LAGSINNIGELARKAVVVNTQSAVLVAVEVDWVGFRRLSAHAISVQSITVNACSANAACGSPVTLSATLRAFRCRGRFRL